MPIAAAAISSSRIATNARFSNYAVINVLPRMGDISRADGLFLESAIAAIASDSPEAKKRLRDFLDKKAGKVAPPE